jgi:MFS family permease
MSLLSPSSGLGVLRNRNLSFYLSARFLGTLAVQMQSVAVGWQVYQITHSLFDLGLIGLAQFAPFLALILWAGHVADTHNRRTIILLCMATQLLCGLLLLLFTLSGRCSRSWCCTAARAPSACRPPRRSCATWCRPEPSRRRWR